MSELVVTDHALARLIERHFKLDRQQIIQKLLPKDVLEAIESAGGTCTFESGGLKYVIKDYVLKTVLTHEMRSDHDRPLKLRGPMRKGSNSRAFLAKFKEKRRRESDNDTA